MLFLLNQFIQVEEIKLKLIFLQIFPDLKMSEEIGLVRFISASNVVT